MPFNVGQGNTVRFVIEFFDAKGIPNEPTSAIITISYTNTSLHNQRDVVTLVDSQGLYNGYWSSTSAALGAATYTITAYSTYNVANGVLNIIARRGG